MTIEIESLFQTEDRQLKTDINGPKSKIMKVSTYIGKLLVEFQRALP